MKKIIGEKQKNFLKILRQGKSIDVLKRTPIDELHPLQIVFFDKTYGFIGATIFILLSFTPLIFINNLWLKIIGLIIVLFIDYRLRFPLGLLLIRKICIYEALFGDEE